MLYRKKLLSDEQVEKIKKSKSWILLYELYLDNDINESDLLKKLGLNKSLDSYNKTKDNNSHFCY